MRVDLTWSQAKVRSIKTLTPSVRQFEIVPLDGSVQSWAPGSHINIRVRIGERDDVRSYSLVGENDAGCYRIAVKRHAESRGGSAYMWSLQESALVSVGAPNNLFPLALDAPDYLLIAGGIGITPIFGMAKMLARQNAKMRMLYAVRSNQELAFAQELREVLGDRLEVFISSEGQRIDPEVQFAQLAPSAEVYLCGPLPLVDACRRAWQAQGRPAAAFRIETFGSSGAYAPEAFHVRVPRLGIDVLVPQDRSMLHVLNDAGVDVMFDCRRGECGLCAIDVLAVEGKIDHRDVFLSDHQKQEQRKICACVSRAVGGAITIDPAWRSDAL